MTITSGNVVRRAGATSRPTGRSGCLDMTPYGRREAWEDNP